MKKISLLILAIAISTFFINWIDEETIQDDTVYLDGCYATSTSIPFNSYDVYHLFDDNTSTQWKTMKGAGPAEGIMIYFDKPVKAGRFEMDILQENQCSTTGNADIFVNGTSAGAVSFENATASFSFDDIAPNGIKSMYIKFRELEPHQENTRDYIKNNNGYEEKYTAVLSLFDKNFSIGLSEIRFFDVTGKRIKIKAPQRISGTMTASSILQPSNSYSPENLFDHQKASGWAEGSAGAGVNEWIHFNFDEPVSISGIKIWNGYQRSDKHYNDNARAKQISFGATNSSEITYELKDQKAAQKIIFNQGNNGQDFKMSIKSIFPGSKYQDLVLSELTFYNGNQPFIINTPAKEDAIISTLSSIKGTVMEKFCDRSININESDDGSKGRLLSFVLRSNQTFVIYDDQYDGASGSPVIYEGNWEVLKQDAIQAEIRIFGKYYFTDNAEILYKRKTEEQVARVFQEKLTFTKDKIKGQKIIGDIDLPNF
jgi:Domain of unknown function (DUF4457)